MSLDLNTAQVLIGGLATLAIFSFLIRENPLYRFFEHLYIGIATGWGLVIGIKEFLWPKILLPMLGLDLVPYPDGTLPAEPNPWLWLYVLPMIIGLGYYFIYSVRYSWIAKLVIGISLGVSGGLAFKGFFAEMMPQIFESFKPLVVFGPDGFELLASFSNVVFVFTLVSVMYYFFFSFRKTSPVLQKMIPGGRWLMMICFGAFFGSTVMARMALLVERLQFLFTEWWPAIKSSTLAIIGIS